MPKLITSINENVPSRWRLVLFVSRPKRKSAGMYFLDGVTIFLNESKLFSFWAALYLLYYLYKIPKI